MNPKYAKASKTIRAITTPIDPPELFDAGGLFAIVAIFLFNYPQPDDTDQNKIPGNQIVKEFWENQN